LRKSEISNLNILAAYAAGYFPMPEEPEGRLLWYRPDPRAIFEIDAFYSSRSLVKSARKYDFQVTFNTSFLRVMLGCADRHDTWIDSTMIRLYCNLHFAGFAQSVEVWQKSRLVGGVYGVCLGQAFFAESMFHRQNGASKWALRSLCMRLKELDYKLLEVQMLTPHLQSLGAIEIPDRKYQEILKLSVSGPQRFL
jgi:leucyl/phenylalanyl-tRNA--protein transferase